MDELKIMLRDERHNYRPNETMDGVAGWRFSDSPKSAELRLLWFTRGKGTEDVGVVNRVRFDNPQAQEGRRFTFTIPAAPYSFSGQLISLVWALELVVGNQTTRVEFTVSPTGREILLHARP